MSLILIFATWLSHVLMRPLNPGGHTNTERGYLPILASKLRRELQGGEYQGFGLTDWEVIVSENDRHPLQFV